MNAPWRSRLTLLTVATAAVAAISVGGALPASAAEANAWATYGVDGTSKAYTGSVDLPGGFPRTTFTSNSTSTTTFGGGSSWQSAATPPGEVYGSSRNQPYLYQRPNSTTVPAVTTYTFDTPSPASGWSFVLGDIDADQVAISATLPDGTAAPLSALGFQSVYNSCDLAGSPSCATDRPHNLPQWNTTTGVLSGAAGSVDSDGASAWFSPSQPLKTLTFTYARVSGAPIYQTWFATKTFAASGTVSVNGSPYGKAALTVRDASGAIVAETTSAGDGSWSVPGLVSTSGYTVSVETPTGASPALPITFDTLDADTPGLDFDFTIPPVTVTATIVDDSGAPVADTPITITREGDAEPTATTTTDADGGFTADLLPGQPYVIAAVGDPDTTWDLTTPTANGEVTDPIGPVGEPAPPMGGGTPGGGTPGGGAPTPVESPVATAAAADPGAPVLAATGSNPAVPLGVGALFVVAGAATLAVRRRRTTRDY